jgi:hypothetical protein
MTDFPIMIFFKNSIIGYLDGMKPYVIYTRMKTKMEKCITKKPNI